MFWCCRWLREEFINTGHNFTISIIQNAGANKALARFSAKGQLIGTYVLEASH